MSYRITTYSALVGNLATANTAVMLCRANIERIPMTSEEQSNVAWRVSLQIRELEGLLAHLKKADRRTHREAPGGTIVDFPPV